MTYNINVSGRRDDAVAALTTQAAQQRTGLQAAEQQAFDKAITEATDLVTQNAGENDSVSISVSGHYSQTDTALGIGKSCGISISRGTAPAAQPDASSTTGTQPAATGTIERPLGAAPSSTSQTAPAPTSSPTSAPTGTPQTATAPVASSTTGR
jgi:hypothetical protein